MKLLAKYKIILIVVTTSVPSMLFAQSGGGGGGCGGGGTGIQNPISFCTFGAFIAAILDIVVTIGIPIAAIFIIYAGFLFVTARGNEQQLEKAKSALIAAIIGTAVLLGASVLANAIDATIQGITP